MTNKTFKLQLERPKDATTIEHLNALAFGPGRFALTAYRVREMAQKIDELCFTAWSDGHCIGSIRHSRVACGDQQGLMLGPLVVHPDYKSQGCGIALIERATTAAAGLDYKWVVLVGDLPYYSRAGFQSVPVGQITFPGPVDPSRILLKDLQPSYRDRLHGTIRPLKLVLP